MGVVKRLLVKSAVLAAMGAGALAAASFACGTFGEDAPASDAASDGGGAADGSDAPATTDGPGRAEASAGCPGAAACERYVFVTAMQFTGALGGVGGADQLCQRAADTADMPIIGKTFKAWISGVGMPVGTRLVHGTKAYLLPTGAPIANSWDALLSGPLLHAINVDEKSRGVGGTGDVWTNTANGGGTPTRPGEPDCADWTTSTRFGNVGELSSTTLWSDHGNVMCSFPTRLYCFEQ